MSDGRRVELGHGPIRLLLPVEQEQRRGARGGQVSVDEQHGERLVEVTANTSR